MEGPIINNEVEIAIETVFREVRTKPPSKRDWNGLNRASALLWTWMVQEKFIIPENVAEWRVLQSDAEVFASKCEEKLREQAAEHD